MYKKEQHRFTTVVTYIVVNVTVSKVRKNWSYYKNLEFFRNDKEPHDGVGHIQEAWLYEQNGNKVLKAVLQDSEENYNMLEHRWNSPELT